MSKEITIDERISQKQKQLKGLYDSMKLYFNRNINVEDKCEVDNLSYRMEFKLKSLEEEGLDFKIETYKKVLELLKKNLSNVVIPQKIKR